MLTVAMLMQAKPESVPPDMTLTRLERLFLSSGFSGFPVVKEERVVGVVSRSDVVRSLLTERSRAEQISDFYSETGPVRKDSELQSLDQTAAQVGIRIAGLRVKDVMIQNVVSVGSDVPVRDLAQTLFDGHLHRLPVIDDDRLVGLITSMDLVQAIADGRFVERNPAADYEHQLT